MAVDIQGHQRGGFCIFPIVPCDLLCMATLSLASHPVYLSIVLTIRCHAGVKCQVQCQEQHENKMGAERISLFLFTIACVFSVRRAFIVTISKTGMDDPACKNGSLAIRPPCRTIDFVFEGGIGIPDHTVVRLESGNYTLEKDTRFENKHNITITGNKLHGKTHRIICSRENIGIGFLRCGRIVIKGLQFENCGKRRNTATRNIMKITSSIHFVFSKDVQILYSEISNSRGFGVTMIDTGGVVKVTHFYVTHNNKLKGAGSGMLIATTQCGALDLVNCTTQQEQQKYIHNSLFRLDFVYFTGNHNDQPEGMVSAVNSAPKLGQAGGLTIHLSGNASRNNFSLSLCSFYNNKAEWGGGLYIGITNTTQDNRISLMNNAFFQNSAVYGGGGMQVALEHSKHLQSSKDNHIEVSQSYFGFNTGIWGGGVSVKAGTKILSDVHQIETVAPIAFKSLRFFANKATVGSAIALATENLNHNPIGPGVSYSILLQDCDISRNEIIQTEDKKVVGQGAVYAEEFMLAIESTVFSNNSGTALVLDSSSFTVKGNVTFKQNKGEKGGAIALYGSSWIKLRARSILLFVRNMAIIKGGALYFKYSGVKRVGFQTTKLATKECFFRYEDQGYLEPSRWDSQVVFIDNMAPDATGNSIFASTLQMCRQKDEARMGNSALEWPNVFQYLSTFNRSFPEIATEAINITSSPKDWRVSPSVPFTPKVKLIDEKGNSVYGTLKVLLKSKNDPSIHLDPPNAVFLIKDEINNLKIDGKENTDFFVSFMTTDGQLTKTEPAQTFMNYCPPGYKQNNQTKVCTCMENEKAITRCENFTAYLLAGYWGQNSKITGQFEAFKCPRNYCGCKKMSKNDYYECAFSEITCGINRNGKMCSECVPGYSVLLGTEKCTKCSDYYALLIIPILLVASGFVLVIFYFNFDAFSGYLNAFLYSYQSIDTVLPETVKLDPFINIIKGVLCLSGTGNTIGLCLFDGFTDLQKLGFNLAVPLYILIFTVLVGTCLSGKLFHKCIGNSFRSNSFGRALSFVYTYCYTALTSKALLLLNPVKIDDNWMLYSAANVPFFGTEHFAYGIAAVLVLIVFTFGFPILLLFTPYFTKHFQSISRMEPAFNALKLCFKNPINSKNGSDFGQFAAFYFICRLVVLLCDVFVKDETPRLVLIALASIFFQAVFSWFQPYVIWTMNFWDVLLLTNMCVVSIVSIIVSVPYMLNLDYIIFLTIVLKALVYVPLLVTVMRLIAYTKRIRERKRKQFSSSMEGKPFFLVNYVGKGHRGLYKTPTKEERRKQKAKRRERSDHVY